MKNIKMILMSVVFCVAAAGCEKYEDDYKSSVVETSITTSYITSESETSTEETSTTETTTATETSTTTAETTTVSETTTKKSVTTTSETTTEAPVVINPIRPEVNHNVINKPAETTTTTTYCSEETVDTVKDEETVATFLASDIDTAVSIDTTVEETVTTEVETSISESTIEETFLTTLGEAFIESTLITEETSTEETSTEEITSETLITTEEILETEEYVVYKPSTNYIHRSTCHWVNDTCIKIDEIGDLRPRICSECKPNEIIKVPETTVDPVSKDGMTYVKRFKRGTLYCYGCAKKGGSGRQLINCAWGNDEVRGSIASSYLYRNYGYKYSGGRTKVYLELPNYPSMNGYYYLDDSDAGNSEVIDFFCYYKNDLPFGADGTGVTPVDCWIVD